MAVPAHVALAAAGKGWEEALYYLSSSIEEEFRNGKPSINEKETVTALAIEAVASAAAKEWERNDSSRPEFDLFLRRKQSSSPPLAAADPSECHHLHPIHRI